MIDRLAEQLEEHDVLYGVVCRDATLTDIELMAQAGYQVVWLDLEHSPMSATESIRLGRSITHLGMVPLVRIPELSRTHVQILLDGGVQILALPDVQDAEQATELVRLGKYPPLGQRGIASTGPGLGFDLGTEAELKLRQANEATRLLVMIEGDHAFAQLDSILAVDGIDIVAVGPSDWSISLGLFTAEQKQQLAPKIDRVLSNAAQAGKLTAMPVASVDEASHYRDLGVRLLFVGVDVALKRRTLYDTLGSFRDALG